MNDKNVQIIAAPHPFLTERVDLLAVAGGSLADVLDQSGLTFVGAIDARIFVNDLMIPREQWESFIPLAGDIITLRAIPQGGGGGGKNILRVVMTIAMIAAMPQVGMMAGTLINTATGLTGAVCAGMATVVQAGVMYGGMQLINAICPPPKPSVRDNSGTKDSQSYGIEGAQNQVSPWNPVPVILGRHKFIPPYAARPYTSIIDGKQYLHCLFCIGYAPLFIYEEDATEGEGEDTIIIPGLRLGNTALKDYVIDDDSTAPMYKIHNPFNPAADTFEFFTDNCVETTVNVELKQADGWTSRTIDADDFDEISIDIVAPSGLRQYHDDGSTTAVQVDYEIQYRRHDSGNGAEDNWSVGIDGVAISQQTVAIPSATQVVQRHKHGKDGTYHTHTNPGYRRTWIGFNSITGSLYTKTDKSSKEQAGQSPTLIYKNIFPSYVDPICCVTRYSSYSTVSQNQITDLRTASKPHRANTTDFAPTATSPASGNISLAAGTLYLSPSIKGNTTSAIRKTYRFGALGSSAPYGYDIRVRRTTSDGSDSKLIDTIYWSCMRAHLVAAPVTMPGLTLIEMMVQATDQLNGVIADFNCVAFSMTRGWNSTSQVWEDDYLTNNPAALFRHVLQGPYASLPTGYRTPNRRPALDSQINLSELQVWHEDCETNGYAFNQPIDYQSTVQEILQNIAAAGRASLTYKDGKYTIIQDKVKTTPVQHFTPHNSWNFRSTKNLITVPHAFRVRFADEDGDWKNTERMVYADGYDSTNATVIEELQLVGNTDRGLSWKHGRYHLAQLILRPEEYAFETDIENLVCTRGDLIRVTHDVPMWGLGTGRVKALVASGSNTTGVVMDEAVTMETGKAYSVRFRLSSGATLLCGLTTVAGESATLTLTTPVATASGPQKGDLGMFGETGSESVQLLVKGITPNSDLTATLACVDYSPDVFTADQGTIPAFNEYISSDPTAFAPIIESIRSDATVLLRDTDGSYKTRIFIMLGLQADTDLHNISSIEGQYRLYDSGESWIKMPAISRDTAVVSLENIEVGKTYEIRFRYVFADARTGVWCEVESHTVEGMTAVPTDASFDDANCSFQADRIVFAISGVVDPDLDFYEIRINTNWGTATGLIYQGTATRFIYANPVNINATYYLKARNKAKVYSANADTITGLTDTLSIATPTVDFSGVECRLTWGATDPLKLLYYVVTVYSDVSRSNLLYTSPQLTAGAFTYGLDLNAAQNGGTALRQLYFTVTVTDVYGRTASANASALNPTPSTPSAPTVTGVFGGLEVTWTHGLGDITGYTVQYGTNNPPSDGTSLWVQGNKASLSGLVPGGTYYVRIQAFDAFGASAWSSVTSGAPLFLGLSNYNLDIPLLSGFTWTSAGWSAGTLAYKGVTYSIAAGTFSGTNCYVYWNQASSPTTFQQSATAPALGADIWLIAFLDIDNSAIHVADAHKIIHGGLIQAESITADQLAANSITASKLAIGDTQITANNDVAFICSFDNSLKTSRGDDPTTATAVTLRPDGKFGGCVAVEKAVTNLLEGYTDFTGWTTYGGAAITLTQGMAGPFGGTGATRIQAGSGSTTTKYGSPQTLTASGTSYADQAWIKALTGNVYVYNGFSTQTITPGDGWIQVMQESVAGDGTNSIQILFSAAASTDSLDFLAYQPQIETGTFCNSFVATSKAASVLQYAHKFIDVHKGSLSLWINFNKPPTTTDVAFYVLDLPHASTRPLYIYRPGGSANLRLRVAETSVCTHNVSTYGWVAHEWHHIAASWNFDTSEWIFCVDGIVHESNTSLSFPTGTWTDALALGNRGGSTDYPINGLIDDFRIDSEPKTAEELQAWYYLGGPHVDPRSMSNSAGTVLINSRGMQLYNASLEIQDTLDGSLKYYGRDNATDGRGAGDLVLGDDAGGIDWDQSEGVLTVVGSGAITGGVSIGTPSDAGLFLGSDYMGYHDGDSWKNYIKNDGSFGFIQSQNNVNDDPTAAMLTNSGLDSFSAANLLDGSTSTTGFTCDSCAAGSNFIVDLGAGNATCYGKLRLYMSAAAFARTFSIAYSDDNSTYTTAKSAWKPSASGWNEISWGNLGFHRYWKVTVAGSAVAGPDVMEMEWYTAGSYITFDNAELSMMLKQIIVSSPQGILVNKGGDITLEGDSVNTAQIIFEQGTQTIKLGYTNVLGILNYFKIQGDYFMANISDFQVILLEASDSSSKTYSSQVQITGEDSSNTNVILSLKSSSTHYDLWFDAYHAALFPYQNNTIDFGASDHRIKTIYTHNSVNVGDFPFFDEIDDLAAIKQIQPLKDKTGKHVRDSITNNILIDDDTLPDILLHRHSRDMIPAQNYRGHNKGDIARDPDGKPYIPLKAGIALAWGGIKQLDGIVTANHEALLKRIEALEKNNKEEQ